MEYDGRTKLLTAVADNLNPEKTYHLKLAIANKTDKNYGSGVFLANLDLGVDAYVDSPWKSSYNWPAGYDDTGLDQWYTGCPQTLTLAFTPNPADRTINLNYLGLAEKYIVDASGKALPTRLKLAGGDTIIRLDIKTLAVPEAMEGQTGAVEAVILQGGGKGLVYLTSAQAGEVKIYGISGSLLQTFTLPAASKSSVTLPVGIYIVSLNGKTYKVVVR
ncbi:MAG: T9SS type A sorting domain-containing protein [Tannerella sp.]|nr:T9SS type A sorting domain-containing protein [Tannerella sp.]